MFRKLLLGGGVFSMLLVGVAAHADTITAYLNTPGNSTLNACSVSTPCGTITITDNGSGGVNVTETLAGSNFYPVTGANTNHVSLAADLDATPSSITFTSSLPSGLSWITGTNASPAGFSGDYDYYVTLSGCNGGSCPQVNTLSFTLGGVSTADFDLAGVPFVSDISVGGATGNVGATGTSVPTPTPEPSSLALLGTGILGLAGAVRRRFRA